ncbi:MAG: ferrous iron transport protein B [Chloroflexi bacterium]|nr:ferrous iron transport protein B [Chloroflexota bacterium]
MKTERVIALAGNPNTGKSTLFNALTGARQHVGNWPGKTVEKKEGRWVFDGRDFLVVDLPGAYSLSAYSLEELITREFIIDERPDAVIIVLDATNLERNLYLAVQILEIGVPAVIALNMMDAARAQGLEIDAARLAQALGAAVTPLAARTGWGLDKLQQAVVESTTRKSPSPPLKIDYGPAIEAALGRLQAIIEQNEALARRYPARWLAIKLIENDDAIRAALAGMSAGQRVLALAQEEIHKLRREGSEDVDILIADRRYRWINRLVHETVQQAGGDRATLTDRIDRIVTHRWLGVPIFFLAMWLVFGFTIEVTAPYLDWLTAVLEGPVSHVTRAGLAWLGLAGTWVESLLLDGVIAGVGGVLVFLPVLMALYIAMALLEDSGYMARAAFVMDRFMRRLGLHGKSFIPLVLGFGCNVPAIYATRTLESRRDRILTGLLVPFMSCGARLPVYALIATVFFSRYGGLAIFSMYLMGIAAALLVGLILRRTLLKGEDGEGLLLELPAYRAPTLRHIWRYAWERTAHFLRGAARVIVIASMVVWLLMAIPMDGESAFAEARVEDSAFARAAGLVAPAFAPLGFGSWQAVSSLISGFVAKEVVVSTLAQAYAASGEPMTSAAAGPSWREDVNTLIVGFVQATIEALKAIPGMFGIRLGQPPAQETPPNLIQNIRAGFEASSGGHANAAAFAFMVFVLLYTPCVATLAALRQEFGSRWMWTSIVMQLTLAWLAAFVIFQFASRLQPLM